MDASLTEYSRGYAVLSLYPYSLLRKEVVIHHQLMPGL
jgi:hypothetical protein